MTTRLPTVGSDSETWGTVLNAYLTAKNSFISVKDYDAVGDGSSHPLSTAYGSLAAAQVVYPFATSLTQELDYCACKAASNAALGADGVEHGSNYKLNKPIYIPEGNYWFGNDTWTIRNAAGIHISGAARTATILRSNVTALAFDGLWYSRIERMQIEAATTSATAAFEVDGNVPGHPYATRSVQANTFADLLVTGGGSSYAMAMLRQGGSGGQGDHNELYNCHFSNASDACYFQNGYNALNTIFIGGDFQNYSKHGIYIIAGSIQVFGTTFESTKGYQQIVNDGWDIRGGGAGAFECCCIYGCRTEGLRFLYFQNATQVDIRACSGRSSLSDWFANVAYGPVAALGQAIKRIAIGGKDRMFVATTPGTSGATEPVWPTNGSPIADGTITWTEDDDFLAIDVESGSIDRRTTIMQLGRIRGPYIDLTVEITANYTVPDDVNIVVVGPQTSGVITVTLSVTNSTYMMGRRIRVKNQSNFRVTVQGGFANFIDHSADNTYIPPSGYVEFTYVASGGAIGNIWLRTGQSENFGGIWNVTNNETLALLHRNGLIELDKATAITLTVPPNASVAFPIGSRVAIEQHGAGQVTIVAGAGVTIRSLSGNLTIPGQYGRAELYKRDTNEWVLSFSGFGAGGVRVFSYAVENLAAGEDIGDGTAANARTVFIAPAALTVSKLSILSQGTPAGINDANPLVIKVYRVTNLIVTKTYNTATVFPADHAQGDLGALANNVFAAGEDLRFDVVCGATANPPSFVLQGEYS